MTLRGARCKERAIEHARARVGTRTVVLRVAQQEIIIRAGS